MSQKQLPSNDRPNPSSVALEVKNLMKSYGAYPGVWDVNGWPNLPDTTWVPGKFISPHAACWDKRGDMYVVEWIEEGRVTKLRRV